MKILCLITTALFLINMESSAQTVKDNIDQKVKDPKTAENAAKADVYIIRNKQSIDLLSDTAAKPATINGKKEKINCRKKKSS